jgi:hypothetical protein
MKFIPNAVSVKVALTLLKTQKHSPTIMFGAGVVGVVATAVFASKATIKGVEIIEEHKALKAGLEGIGESAAYTHEDLVKDKALLLTQTAIKIAKIYAPAVVIGAASIGLLTGSHIMITRRNAAVTAAYAALDKAFREYRERVTNKVGPDEERKLFRNVQTEKVTVTDENGKKKQANVEVSKGGSAYSRLYGEITREGFRNANWQELPELNVLFLRNVERMLNNQLHSRGFLFLNEAYDALGLDWDAAGQQVGWLSSERGGVDGFVDFGIFDKSDDLGSLYNFATGREGEIWLDFNVDGLIMNKI